MVEFDVRRCGNGELVVVHDETVDRVTDGNGRVADLTPAALSDLDVLDTEEGVPTVEEVLAAVPSGTDLNVELKERELAQDLVEALADHDHEVLISSFDDEALREMAAVADLPLAIVFAEDRTAGLDSADELDAAAIHPHWQLLDREYVERAHERGLAVNCWTVRSDRAVERATRAGVDGLISDDPRFCKQ
jgi:glycerophosphoryl diester phosphodiesterase